MTKPGTALAKDAAVDRVDGPAGRGALWSPVAVAHARTVVQGVHRGLGLLVVLLVFLSCTDQQHVAKGGAGQKPTSGQEIDGLVAMVRNTTLPPEVRAHAVMLLAAFDPAETVQPLVAMLAADEPLVLVAVIENLPQAAEEMALRELKQLSSRHPNPEVQAAARARLTEFEEFHQ